MRDAETTAPGDPVATWAASGAMALTGASDRAALGPPADLVPGLERLAADIRAATALLGHAVDVDPVALLGERAAIAGLTRNGTTSCGGATRLLPTRSGWVAVSLPRPSDIDLVPAWLECEIDPGDDPWEPIAAHVRARSSNAVVAAGAALGLPVGALPTEREATSPARPWRSARIASGRRTLDLEGVVVVDLSALWAGPLCGSLLRAAGADVWKIESTRRPDGARQGPRQFFDLMNGGKRSVALDFTTGAGRNALRVLIEHADVVIEASRPRALEQLGVDAAHMLAGARPRVWVSITAHGRRPPGGDRVGFGDDAAVAGGLVSWDEDTPNFCADAVADPVTGLSATVACLDALTQGGSWLVDVSMSDVAATHAGPTIAVPTDLTPGAPAARRVVESGPSLGHDTDAVMGALAAMR